MPEPLHFQRNHSNVLPRSTSPASTNGSHIHDTNDAPAIKDVWEDNFEEEFSNIMNLIDRYKVIAMDTEFPGIVFKLTETDVNSMNSLHEIEYRTIKMNVDKLKVIQVGITLADENGYLPQGVSTWQFNFKFDLNSDEYSREAIDLLSNSGIKFEKHNSKGINAQLFAEYLIASGLVLNDELKWISFHGGFDFGYLLKMLHGQSLPEDDDTFYVLMKAYFPNFYDIKWMVRNIESLKNSGLSKIAHDLIVKRIGPQHQAGSDSLLTLSTYFKLKETYLKGTPEIKHNNVLYGVGAIGDDGVNDYIWQNFIISDYPYSVLPGYGINNMGMMAPQYYPQNDNIYNGMVNNRFNMHYNTLYEPIQKSKKYDMSMRRVKNQV